VKAIPSSKGVCLCRSTAGLHDQIRVSGELWWSPLSTLAALDKGLGLAQSNDGVNPHSAVCGDKAGRNRHNDEDNSEADKGERIAGRDAVEQSRHQVRHNQCAGKPHGGAGKGECESLAQNHV